MHIAFLISLALALLGCALIAYAKLNPKWQSAEAYDSLVQFFIGLGSLVAALLLVVVTGLVWLIRLA